MKAPSMLKVQALLFDLDNTLIDEGQYFDAVFAEFAKRWKKDAVEFQSALAESLRRASRDIFGDVLKAVNFFSTDRQAELFHLYQTIEAKIRFYPDAQDLISFARDRRWKLGIVTNGVVAAQKNKIKCLGAQDIFDCIIYAREFGKENEKPAARPFLEALLALGVNNNEVVFIGDHSQNDILGAKRVGLRNILLNRSSETNPHDENADMCVKDLQQVKNFLKG